MTKEAYVAETSVWSIPFLIYNLTALKGSQFYLYSYVYNLDIAEIFHRYTALATLFIIFKKYFAHIHLLRGSIITVDEK